MSKIAAVNIYRTVDDEIVFGDDNPRARFLVAGAGSEIPDEWADAVSAAGGKAEEPKAETPEVTEPADEPAPEPKVAPKKARNKLVKKAANK